MEREIGHIKTKSIHAPVSPEDGYRISVMSKHTLNDGITPDSLITSDKYNAWMKQFAPPDKLIGAYYKRGLPWDEFEKQYLEFLRTPEKEIEIKRLIELAKTKVITLLCVEDTPDKCHRRLLAEECQRLDSEIQIVIN